MNFDLKTSIGRISYLGNLNNSKKYLEIGVWGGSTFLHLQFPFKFAVDPCFVFDTSEFTDERTFFFKITSDKFFEKLDSNETFNGKSFNNKDLKFDLIFIDGHHTFEQSLKDFENSLRYSHEKTLWLIDDTVPSDAYSALPNPVMSRYKRKLAGLERGDWHGDVYKTIFAIHDQHPEISYCTLMGGNPQTVLWKAPKSDRTPIFSSKSKINSTDYFDMIQHGKLIMPVADESLPNYIFRSIDPAKDASNDSWKKVIVGPNFRKLSPKVTMTDRLIVSYKESLPVRAYKKLVTGGLSSVFISIKNKFHNFFLVN